MKIETIEISKINPAVYNPRKDLKTGDPEYEHLKKSINEFGLIDPLIWNKRTGNLVGGHQRLKILKERGDKEVEVSVVDLDDAKEKALNIALNKISGDWDMPLLKDLLEELDTGDFDMEITGFSEKEIEDLMNQCFVPEEGLTDDDAVPENVETICKKGDLWKLGEHRLLCGDSTVITDVEKLMQGEKADMVFTDPPYGINLDTDYSKLPGGKAKDYKKVIGDEQVDPSLIATIFHNFGYCKEVVIFGADYFAELLPNKNEGSWLVWDKRVEEKFDRMIGSAFELCWSKQKHKREIIRLNNTLFSGEKDAQNKVHPTQKPIKVCSWILEKYSNNNDIVVDLYGGSGSTLIACEKLNRKCRMMEIDEHYCDVIIKRWEDFTGKKAELIKG